MLWLVARTIKTGKENSAGMQILFTPLGVIS